MLFTLPIVAPMEGSHASSWPGEQPSNQLDSEIHLFDTEHGPHVLVVNGSQVYAFKDQNAARSLVENEDLAAIASSLPETATPRSLDYPPSEPQPLRALSLAIAQKCNLACSYCYAREGDFGGEAKSMPLDVALAAVDHLFAGRGESDSVMLVFLGGEPLLNRSVLRATTNYAARLARQRRVRIAFSITTNGTLLTPEDGVFFETHGFAVSISLDGIDETHDQLRAFKSGSGTFARIVANVRPLLAMQRRMQVSARVTVTPRNLALRHTLDSLIAMGFHTVGFSPLLASPSGRDQMNKQDLASMLEQMIACGREFERRVAAGERYPFANMVTALREIHLGAHRPYPCGAGNGYFGVSADGELAACHRFVGDERGAMGTLATGVDRGFQANWLAARHIHCQEPCRSCWARYLCGGGCHHEVLARGRPACDYIRGWLHYCLQAYVRLLAARPEYFGL